MRALYPPLSVPLTLTLMSALAYADAVRPPHAATREVTDTYHGQAVTDPYRWLEDAADPAVKAWSVAQAKFARAYLDSLPARPRIREQIADLRTRTSPNYYELDARGGKLFAMFNKPPAKQPMLVVMETNADPDSARVILDPNKLNPKGTTAIDWFVPSHDAKLVAVSISENGSEEGSLYIFDVTGNQVGEVIPRVQFPTAGGSMAWSADGKGFFYTRYPGEERPAGDRPFYEQLYYHTIGTVLRTDRYVLGRDLPKVAEIS